MMRPRTLLALPALLISLPLHGELEDEVPLGFEGVTGYRSNYVYRGFQLADHTLDFQLEAEVTVAENLYLNLGGWIGTEFSNTFSEHSGFLELRYDLTEQITVGTSATFHDFDNSMFVDGFDLGVFGSYYLTDDWDVTAGAYFDEGSSAWYSELETGWSYRISDDAYFGLIGGVSLVEELYGSSGLHDFFGRVSLTYNINSVVSFTPFAGWSVEFDDTDGDGNELFGGLWFEVSF